MPDKECVDWKKKKKQPEKLPNLQPTPTLHLETGVKRSNEKLAMYRVWYDREDSY